ncbi:MAG TPA: lysophospholipid acyltransferase family protein [Pirellulales bacterium]
MVWSIKFRHLSLILPMRPRLTTAANYLVYLFVRVFVCVLQAVTIETCDRLSRGLAWLVTEVIPLRHDIIDNNLRHAFPDMTPNERRHMTRRMWEHLFLMLAEIAHFPRKVHDTNWRDYIRFKNEGQMMRELFRGRPRVFASGHYGNFELAGYTLGLFGFPTFTVARPLDNPYLDRWINYFRALKGQYVLPKQGSAQEAAALLEGRGTLGVLADQHAGNKGCWVNFFGRPASTHKAIAVFALTNEAPLMVGYARRLGRPLQYEMGMETLIDPATMAPNLKNVSSLTQWYTDILEQVVLVAPEQYWWLHRRWRDDRGPKKRAAQNRAAKRGGNQNPAAPGNEAA